MRLFSSTAFDAWSLGSLSLASVDLVERVELRGHAVGAERKLARRAYREELGYRDEMLERHLPHRAALDEGLDLGVVDAHELREEREVQYADEGLAADAVDRELALCVIGLGASRAQAALLLLLLPGLGLRRALEHPLDGRGGRRRHADRRGLAGLVEELEDAGELLHVGARLRVGRLHARRKERVRPLLLQGELLVLHRAVLLREDERERAYRGVHGRAHDAVLGALGEVDARCDAARLAGVLDAHGRGEPQEAVVHRPVGVLLVEEEILDLAVRGKDDVRHAARPRDLADERVYDVEVLELAVLGDDVAALLGERGLEDGRPGRAVERRAVARVRAVAEHGLEPPVHGGELPARGRGQLAVVAYRLEIVGGDDGLEHDELVLRRDDRRVLEEADLPALERDGVVVERRRPHDRAEPVEVGLLRHHGHRGYEAAAVAQERRDLGRDYLADALGLGAGELARYGLELYEVDSIGLEGHDRVRPRRDLVPEPAEVDVREVLDGAGLEIRRPVRLVAVVQLADAGAALRLLHVVLGQLLVDGIERRRVEKAILGGRAARLRILVSLKHRCASSSIPRARPATDRPDGQPSTPRLHTPSRIRRRPKTCPPEGGGAYRLPSAALSWRTHRCT